MNEDSIFAKALALKDAGEREAFLDEACGEQPELRAQVEELLAADSDAGSFLNHAPVGMEATVAVTRGDGDTEKSATWTGVLPLLAPCDTPGRIGKLGHYEIIEVVGHGGMGAVLRAFDTKLSRIVAVKVMAPELAANPTAVKRFLREAQSAASVHHDHVITIHNVDETHRPPYLVMEFIEGQTLQQKIEREGALSLTHILRIGSQMAAGLAAAHKLGLIHRDVKPGNILLENGVERVKITDFGLARAADDLEMTQTGMIAGTPQYMSPEQAKGELIDARSDLFSLGSVLYTMCTGRAAFRAETTMGVLRRVCDDVPRPIAEINTEIPPWLAAIVGKLLAKNPSDRFQTAAEVAELLGQHLAHVQNPALVPRPTTIVSVPPRPTPARLAVPLDRVGNAQDGGGAGVAILVVIAALLAIPVAVVVLGVVIALVMPVLHSRSGQTITRVTTIPPVSAPLQNVEPRWKVTGWGSSWSPDSRLLIRQKGRTQQDTTASLQIVEVATGREQNPLQIGKDPCWSPVDGGPIAYVVQKGRETAVWMMDSDGKNARRVSDGSYVCGWSPDGATLFDFANQTLRAIDWAASDPKPKVLLNLPGGGPYPRVSPDGRLVASYAIRDGGKYFDIREIASGQLIAQTPLDDDWHGVLCGWSPDGKQVGYSDYGLSNAGLFLLDLSSGKSRKVLDGSYTLPRWSPDGQWIAADDRIRGEVTVLKADELLGRGGQKNEGQKMDE